MIPWPWIHETKHLPLRQALLDTKLMRIYPIKLIVLPDIIIYFNYTYIIDIIYLFLKLYNIIIIKKFHIGALPISISLINSSPQLIFSSVQFNSVQFSSVQIRSVQTSSVQFSSDQLLTILLLSHITIHFSSVQLFYAEENR